MLKDLQQLFCSYMESITNKHLPVPSAVIEESSPHAIWIGKNYGRGFRRRHLSYRLTRGAINKTLPSAAYHSNSRNLIAPHV